MGSIITYEELATRLADLANSLRAAGLAPGHRVVTVLPDGAATVQLILALICMVTCCPLDPMLSEREYASRFDLARPAAVVVGAGRSPRAQAAARAKGVAVIEIGGNAALAEVIRVTGTLTRSTCEEPLPPGLLLATSGTTGAAKLAVVPWPTMLAGARATVRAYRLARCDRRLNIMPLFHIQGLVGSVLPSLVAGGSVSCASTFSPAAVTRSLLDESVTWFSASPTMHQQILDAADPSWRPAPALRFVRCGSAALPAPLRERLERIYRVPVVESYGMTEAHQIASTPLPPDEAEGLAPTGSQLAIEVAPGSITTEPGQQGQVLVRGDNVIPGYLPSDHGSFIDGWFRTGDRGELLKDGSLRLTGRIRELIIRGGENISPLEIEEVLRAHPAVRDACVVGAPDPVLGERIAAAVTLDEQKPADPVDLRSFAGQRLAAFKVPEVIIKYDKLPVTGSGKVARAEVAQQLADVIKRQGDAVSAVSAVVGSGADEAEDVLLTMWRAVLGTDALGADDDFFAAGGDSLTATSLLTAVAERFGVEISPLTMFDEASTARTMAVYIVQHLAATGEASA